MEGRRPKTPFGNLLMIPTRSDIPGINLIDQSGLESPTLEGLKSEKSKNH
jgi:hypothetical protein